MKVAQSSALYTALLLLRQGSSWAELDACQQRIVQSALRDADLSGVALAGIVKQRFDSIEQRLAALSTTFANNLLDATKEFELLLRSPDELIGLSPEFIAAAAVAGSHTGPWRVTLDPPVYNSFMEQSARRDLRESLYRAFVTRASHSPHDNGPIAEDILGLRREKAFLLGLGSYAELSLASKTAPSVADVMELMAELRSAALPRAQQEHEALCAFAQQRSADGDLALEHWDVPFWSERMREEHYAYSEEELRPYFSIEQVLKGLFLTARRLFDVEIVAADGQAPVWDPTVRFFQVRDLEGKLLAHFFLDAYTRPESKRGGAWMDGALSRKRRRDGTVRLPLAYLVCNISASVGGLPSLMTFRNVLTLFHEFGHALQHMLTTVDYVAASGINNVEWDAIELPSKFMEHWCYTPETIQDLARHFRTSDPLPTTLFLKLLAARTYGAGAATLRHVYLATLDLELHSCGPAQTVLEVQRRVAAANAVMPPLNTDRSICAFSHIFSGGYAAGYYSYKWAEVLAADAFSAFTEGGPSNPVTVLEIGRRFRDTVLSLGGSVHPLQVFYEFRGRPPSTGPLLRLSGLLN